MSKNFPTAKAAFNLETFTFNDHTLRTVRIDGTLWLSVSDIGAALGYKTNGVFGHVARVCNEDEIMLLQKSKTTPELRGLFSARSGRLALVSESGLYKFSLRAQRTNPAARDFQEWVTREVLPRIRRDGAYIMGEEKVAINNPPS